MTTLETLPPEMTAWLESCEPDLISEEGMLRQRGNGIGYHTRLTVQDWAHPIRENFDYALILLAANRPGDRDHACSILHRLLSVQDTDAASKTYGIWSWYLEEPLEKMNPPDWNWAGFCGLRIVLALLKFGDDLPAGLVEELRVALEHAARSIIRRDVGPHYTNIAFLGAQVSLGAGEILEEPAYVLYGRTLLGKILESVEYHGNFNEYNSPAYTTLLLTLCEAILESTTDQEALATAEKLRRVTWQSIADSFHPMTSQWAGPFSRSYAAWLRANEVHELTSRLGFDLSCYTKGGHPLDPSLVRRLPCPADLVQRFKKLPQENYEIKRRFVRREPETKSQCGTTWFSTDACLGSINQGFLWNQARPLLAYWALNGKPPLQLRLRFLHDGQDFVSAWSTNEQQGTRVLTAISFLTDGGDTHPVFYKPRNAEFEATDFRLRYEVLGEGVEARELSDGRFELRAGAVRALIQPLGGIFGSETVKWTLGRTEGGVVLDAICYAGPRKTFSFLKLNRAYLTAGLELVHEGEPDSSVGKASESVSGDKTRLTWSKESGALCVEYSATPHPQPF